MDLTPDFIDDALSRRETGWVLRRCSRRGHVAVWTSDEGMQAELQLIGPNGPLLRCVRCGTYVSPSDPTIRTPVGSPEAPVALAEVPLAVRGAHGRKLGLLRLLAVERAGRGLLMIVAGLAAFQIINQRGLILSWLQRVLNASRPLDTELGAHILDSPWIREIQNALSGTGGTIQLAGLALLGYGALQIVEGVGLWGGWRWAEYLAVVATSAFIPLEVYELIHKASVLKGLALVINVGAVIYLVFKGRLFGVRGGHASFLREVRESTLLADLLRARGRSVDELASHEIV